MRLTPHRAERSPRSLSRDDSALRPPAPVNNLRSPVPLPDRGVPEAAGKRPALRSAGPGRKKATGRSKIASTGRNRIEMPGYGKGCPWIERSFSPTGGDVSGGPPGQNRERKYTPERILPQGIASRKASPGISTRRRLPRRRQSEILSGRDSRQKKGRAEGG